MASDASALPDLTACETEPIRFPGSVQPRGALLVVDPVSTIVAAASDTCASLLGRSAQSLLGRPLAQVLDPDAASTVLSDEAVAAGDLVDLSVPDRSLVARGSRNAQAQVLIDIEPGSCHAPILQQHCRRLARRLRHIDDEEALAQAAAEGVRALTGHDRVMVYRFDADWNGEVLGEAAAAGLEPYLGLHYPASDIPRQARELFALARVRLITDVDDVPSALLAVGDAKGIDLGLSSLRSVSPVHLEYCRNMGVRATLVGSLVVEGRLWGLVSCHHCNGPLSLAPAERDALGDLCADLADQIGVARLRRRERHVRELAGQRTRLVEMIRHVDLRALLGQPAGQAVLDVMAADGFALVKAGEVHARGRTPSADRLRFLVHHARLQASTTVRIASHALAADLDLDEAPDGVAGAVVVAVNTIPEALLAWFRAERSVTVRWAGDPTHPHHAQADGRISPRQSFAAFLRLVRGRSLPWSPEEIASAADLATLIEIDALREREAFNQTILNSSPEHLCVLDRRGVIVSVNDAWVRFARANGAAPGTQSAVGLDYREICRAAGGRPGGHEAGEAWQGISAVLEGTQPQFSMDYPCDSPDERRWFQMLVYPLGPPCEGAVVLHQNITSRKRAEEAAHLAGQRLRGVLQDQTELICRFRCDGTILYVNEAYCRFFGKTADTLIGQRWQPVAWPEDVQAVEDALRTLTPAHPVVTIENRVIAGDGQVRWGQFVNRAIFDAEGRLVEMQAVARDITERKAIEAELALHRDQLERLVAERTQALEAAKATAEAALSRLQEAHDAIQLGTSTRRAAMQSMTDAVLVTDAAGTFVDFNDAFAHFHRFADRASSPTSLAAYQTLVDAYLPSGAPATREQWAVSRALRGEAASSVEFALRRRDTGETWIGSHSYAPIRIDGGQILGAVVTARDVTRERRAAMDLQQAKEAAETANRAKTSFLATMSHELRTPMNAIMGMTDLALRRATEPRQTDLLRKAQKASRHLLSVISDVLDIARIESERRPLKHEVFQLDGLLENLAAQMRVLRGDRPLDCTVQAEPPLRRMRLRGDPTRLLQVLLNLAGNAIKYTPSGFVRVVGTLEQQSAGRVRLRFDVQDSGIGIDAADRDRVFQPFWQADSSSTRAHGGAGLGLAVSRQLVGLMNGQIDLHPMPGGGTCFWFTVELDKAGDLEEPAPDPAPDITALAAQLRARHPDASVVVVDDDDLNREVTVTLLEDCGLRVHTAVEGREAVDLVAHMPVDLVLMDVQMPGMNGLDATRQIRQQARGLRVPVIALSANVFDEDRSRCLAAGMDDFIGRPCEATEMLAKVLHWLDRRTS
ncbi:MAG: PAS domain S-box protein [Rubrivivax sp.]